MVLARGSIPQISQKNLFSENPINDIEFLPQSAHLILQVNNGKGEWVTNDSDFTSYIQAYFAPWSANQIDKDKEKLEKHFAASNHFYAENFSQRPLSWLQAMRENADRESVGKIQQKAMIVSNTSLRNLPTLLPCYIDPKQAGEGYPFDVLQENLLHIGEPVLISHYTKDGKFALVLTNAQSHGFVQVQDIALVDEATAAHLLKQRYAMVSKDQVNLYDNNNLAGGAREFLHTVYLGTLLPASPKGIYLPVKGEDNRLKLKEVKVDLSHLITTPLKFTALNAAKVIDQLIGQPYGWGGYLMHRDCAQLLKDYFAVFGIHLPIFSGNQIKSGRYISLENMSKMEKLSTIKAQAQPFATILYRKGHVTLYLGEYRGKPVMLHALWGVHLYDNNNDEYRHIIGKTAITTLEYGKELPGFDETRSNFLNAMSAMAILPQ